MMQLKFNIILSTMEATMYEKTLARRDAKLNNGNI